MEYDSWLATPMNALANVLKVMDLRAVQEKARSDTVHWRITPALVEELVSRYARHQHGPDGQSRPGMQANATGACRLSQSYSKSGTDCMVDPDPWTGHRR